ncbi:MAG TPA: hypothetical protein VMT23_00750 [Candidatus Binatia bacterium]|nr:hypothetical protein [Candidatus Binatia bacterium]
MTKTEFDPYLTGVEALHSSEIDARINELQPSVAYYGEIPDGAQTALRQNYPAIEVPDDGGITKYSVLVSGDLKTAKTVLIRSMSWSDHPGRGFEALREALIADPSSGLAVVGVSFPGAGFSSEPMTAKQKDELKSPRGFEYIGRQQWQAIEMALSNELRRATPELNSAQVNHKISEFEFVLAGHSQGASNSVGLFQSAPEDIHISSLGLVEDVAMEAQGWLKFRRAFLTRGSTKFPDYTAANPYNQYPELGPDWRATGLVKNVITRPASHVGAVVEAMRAGTDMDKVVRTMQERDVQSLAITLANGSLGLGSVDAAKAAAELFNRTSKLMHLSDSVLARTVVWDGHYHAAMENLANSQQTFRSFAR